MFLDAKDTALDGPDVHVRGTRDDLEPANLPRGHVELVCIHQRDVWRLVPGSPRPVPDVGPAKSLNQIGKRGVAHGVIEGGGVSVAGTHAQRVGVGIRVAGDTRETSSPRTGVTTPQQLVDRHAVELGQSQEIVSVGRGLAALPLGDGLTAHAQAGRKSLLRKAVRMAQVAETTGYVYVHVRLLTSCRGSAAPRERPCLLAASRGTQAHWHATTFAVAPGTRHHLWFAFCTAGLREGKQMPATQSCGR